MIFQKVATPRTYHSGNLDDDPTEDHLMEGDFPDRHLADTNLVGQSYFMSDDLPWDDLSDGGRASGNLDEGFPWDHRTGGGSADDLSDA